MASIKLGVLCFLWFSAGVLYATYSKTVDMDQVEHFLQLFFENIPTSWDLGKYPEMCSFYKDLEDSHIAADICVYHIQNPLIEKLKIKTKITGHFNSTMELVFVVYELSNVTLWYKFMIDPLFYKQDRGSFSVVIPNLVVATELRVHKRPRDGLCNITQGSTYFLIEDENYSMDFLDDTNTYPEVETFVSNYFHNVFFIKNNSPQLIRWNAATKIAMQVAEHKFFESNKKTLCQYL